MAKDTKETKNDSEETKPAKKATVKKKTTVKKVAAKKTTTAAKKTTAAAKKTTAAKKPVAAVKKPAAIAAEKVAPEEKVATEEKVEAQTQEPPEANSHREDLENVFPGLDKDRDWQGFAIRVLYIVAFGFLGWLAFLGALFMTGIQVLITLFLGSPNETLQSWVCSIGKYLSEVFEYISWRTDDRPFPLGRPAPLEETVKS